MTDRLNWRIHWPLALLVTAGLAWGIYARFKGLGNWPLGIDEYYVSRSVEFILASGTPMFPCGGFYARGLLVQYVVAGLQMSGLTPEFAVRAVAATASLAVFPAVYLLGRRLQGPVVGLVAVLIMALSVWEIEMARFGRMYAPFQAVFAWYLVFFLRYTVDRDRRALLPMVLLSLLAALTWEGGALVGLLNLLPPLINHRAGKLSRKDFIYLAAMLGLFAVLFLSSRDMRIFSEVPRFSAEVELRMAQEQPAPDAPLWAGIGDHPLWLIGALLPLGLAVASLRWIWSWRERWLTAGGLAAALAAALLHQPLLAGALLLLMLLCRLVEWRSFTDRAARTYVLAVAAGVIGWLAFDVFTWEWPALSDNLTAAGRLVEFGQHLAGFPAVLVEIVKPWASAIPILSLELFLALATLAVWTALRPPGQTSTVSALLVVALCMILAVGASAPPRHETRYSFFLYPVLITLALAGVAYLARRVIAGEGRAIAAAAVASLTLFALGEDFQPWHIANIDSAAVNFRVGMSAAKADHYYPRGDTRKLTDWLGEAVTGDDIVISGVPTVPHYFPKVAYSFLDEEDDRYSAYACNRSTVERWTNLPLLSPTDALAPLVASGRRIFVVLYPDRYDRLKAHAEKAGWRIASAQPTAIARSVLIINPR